LNRYYYAENISAFIKKPEDNILAALVRTNEFDLGQPQRDAWIEEIRILKKSLHGLDGRLFFEYSIPRMGKRIDAIVLTNNLLFVIEFKIGESTYSSYAIDQVWDYALDLKNFHEGSHNCHILPVLLATKAKGRPFAFTLTAQNDKLFLPVCSNTETISAVFRAAIETINDQPIDSNAWEASHYSPTPTIVEAAVALYKGHSVQDISRRDASVAKLSKTTDILSTIIADAKRLSHKALCFVTGVPGAGKTLVGLNIAVKHIDKTNELYSVFLSGNGPLVKILKEALARDTFEREKAIRKTLNKKEVNRREKITKDAIKSRVKEFIQNIHHFRDECLVDQSPPIEHVALFDEAQRAWNLKQTASFMRRKKNRPGFSQSEPEFLISCLDRHKDWAVIICLVGGGQEINTGEAGIGEWIHALIRSFPEWHIYISPRLTDSEYVAGNALKLIENRPNVIFNKNLHLSVSMRSFRAEHVSLLIKRLLDCDLTETKETLSQIDAKYPIVLTRDLARAKAWLKGQARGTERYGIVVSSQAQRLKPLAIDVRVSTNPIHWFLNGKEDVRSSYYLEDVATEFDIQGLELDWACVTWDGDFRYSPKGWKHFSFVGSRWNRIKKEERQVYLKNAYRVLLTRARQGMVIVVPSGDPSDLTRKPEFYDSTFEYLKSIGFAVI
jgi:hypothetical protein